MLYVLSQSYDPYYNLATEEYLLKNLSDDVFMLWRSEPAVIVGKHQNALAEINYPYVIENNIKVARRISGGGTVVHDLENLNFTFIANGEEGKLIDFKKYVKPIIEFLANLGINAQIGKTNDIRIGDLKISGNAEHVYKKRVLHHGTLLFNSDLNQLQQAINVNKGRYFDKAVQSNRASVTNIINHLKEKISIQDFTSNLISFIAKNNNAELYSLAPGEIKAINKLVEEKYNTEKWIWGYSPKYTFKNSFKIAGVNFNVEVTTKNGVIQESFLTVNEERLTVENLINGKLHKLNHIRPVLENEFTYLNLDRKELLELIFNFF